MSHHTLSVLQQTRYTVHFWVSSITHTVIAFLWDQLLLDGEKYKISIVNTIKYINKQLLAVQITESNEISWKGFDWKDHLLRAWKHSCISPSALTQLKPVQRQKWHFIKTEQYGTFSRGLEVCRALQRGLQTPSNP